MQNHNFPFVNALLCKGSLHIPSVCGGRFSYHPGQWLYVLALLRGDRCRYHLKGRRCIPRVYIFLGFLCILCREIRELCHRLMSSLQSKGSHIRHPLLRTVLRAYVLHYHIGYPMLRCRVHCLLLLLHLIIEILCCRRRYVLYMQTVFRVRPLSSIGFLPKLHHFLQLFSSFP